MGRNSLTMMTATQLGLLGASQGQGPLLVAAALPAPPPRALSGDVPFRPPIYVTCACDLAALHRDMRDHQQRYDNERNDVEATTRASLADLRNRLVFIFVGTLAAVVLGSVWIVRRG